MLQPWILNPDYCQKEGRSRKAIKTHYNCHLLYKALGQKEGRSRKAIKTIDTYCVGVAILLIGQKEGRSRKAIKTQYAVFIKRNMPVISQKEGRSRKAIKTVDITCGSLLLTTYVRKKEEAERRLRPKLQFFAVSPFFRIGQKEGRSRKAIKTHGIYRVLQVTCLLSQKEGRSRKAIKTY